MGLRERVRDPGLPARAGEPHLAPLAPDRLLELVTACMVRPGAEAPRSARWDYARWKPGVSMTATYALAYADGSEEIVVGKRYADGKERTLRDRPGRASLEERIDALCPRLLPRVVRVEEGLFLFTVPADRVLRGLPLFLDVKKLASTITRAGIAPAGTVRRRKTALTLLRYKPERRAVYKIDLRLRTEDKRRVALAGRVLPPAGAERVAAARAALQAAGAGALVPPLAGQNLAQGYLLEPWLELVTFEPDAFGHAREAAAVLARLHALEPPAELRPPRGASTSDLSKLFRVDARLGRLAGPRRAAPVPAGARRAFCHGDFHPDQVARLGEGGSWCLLDLDLLHAGDPTRDLACWIADWVIESGRDAAEGARTLLDGYRAAGGAVPDERHLWALVATELVDRAASTVRRLEEGAVERALTALETARALAPRASGGR